MPDSTRLETPTTNQGVAQPFALTGWATPAPRCAVRAITDEVGAVVIRHDYAPFGEDTQPLTGDPMRFAGKELDPETGMNYFAARYYRSAWGRFTSVDPVSGWPSDPQSWNRYAYARNNPLKYVDPSGLAYMICGAGDGGPSCGFYDIDFSELKAWAYQSSMSLTDDKDWQSGTFFNANTNGFGFYVYYCAGSCSFFFPGPGVGLRPPPDDGGGGGPGAPPAPTPGPLVPVADPVFEPPPSPGTPRGPVTLPGTTNVVTQETFKFPGTCGGPGLLAGLGVSGTIGGNPMAPFVGPFAGAGLSINIDFFNLQVVATAQFNPMVGVGMFAGAGVSVQGGSVPSPSTSGVDISSYSEVNIGCGPSVGGSLQTNGQSLTVGGFKPGTAKGYGAALSTGIATSYTWASPSPLCD